jgi:hypothetical protein
MIYNEHITITLILDKFDKKMRDGKKRGSIYSSSLDRTISNCSRRRNSRSKNNTELFDLLNIMFIFIFRILIM